MPEKRNKYDREFRGERSGSSTRPPGRVAGDGPPIEKLAGHAGRAGLKRSVVLWVKEATK